MIKIGDRVKYIGTPFDNLFAKDANEFDGVFDVIGVRGMYVYLYSKHNIKRLDSYLDKNTPRSFWRLAESSLKIVENPLILKGFINELDKLFE